MSFRAKVGHPPSIYVKRAYPAAAGSQVTLTLGAGGGSGSFPTLFQDYASRDFAGEPGALATNNGWSTTVYNYTPQFAPTIPTVPTYIGAAYQTIVTTRAGLTTALGNLAFRHIFIQKGYDDHGGADIAINNAGTAALPRWLLYYDPADVNKDLTAFSPWNLAVGNANRTQLCRLNFGTGSAYYYVVGLNSGKVGGAAQKTALHDGNAHDIIWYRCSMENASTGHCWLVNSGNCDNIQA